MSNYVPPQKQPERPVPLDPTHPTNPIMPIDPDKPVDPPMPIEDPVPTPTEETLDPEEPSES